MIIEQAFYKNIPAIRLTTKTTRAVIVPAQGGKMVSFQAHDNNAECLLQNRAPSFLPMGLADDFERCECAGFDDMFPTIDPVNVICEDGTALDYPDHGEICRLPFSAEVCENKLTLRAYSHLLDCAYEKAFTEADDGKLQISYRIENRSARDLNVLWAAHFLLNVEKGGQLLLPFEKGEPTDIVDAPTDPSKQGARLPLSDELLLTNWPQNTPDCRKLYFPRKAPAGFVGYLSPSGSTFMLEFDREKLPYIGLWINLGYLHGDYCVGIEPATHGYDTVKNAEAHGQRQLLKKGATLCFSLKLSVDR